MKKYKTAKELLLIYLDNINDAEKLIELFAEDASIELPFVASLGVPWKWTGRDELYEFFKSICLNFSEFEVKNVQILIETEDQVFAEYSSSCKIAATGQFYDQDYMSRLVAENGKIILLRESLDTTQFAVNLLPGSTQGELIQKDETIAGIDHIGINVPDIDSASIFLKQALDAVIMYESYSKKLSPLEFDGNEADLNLSPQTRLYACRMIKIGNGPDIELFEVHVNGQREAVMSSDLGVQHFAIYTYDMISSLEKFSKAGGKILSDPNPLLFPLEAGEKNYFCYGITPWGTSVEFITYPDGMPYEAQTNLRRFKGGIKKSKIKVKQKASLFRKINYSIIDD